MSRTQSSLRRMVLAGGEGVRLKEFAANVSALMGPKEAYPQALV